MTKKENKDFDRFDSTNVRKVIDKKKAETKKSKLKTDKPSECYIQFNHKQ
jgi:hypothetical protein|tara:strand:- start:546 stop:695 length:150 start_codon:yes stop_codon:yes gene_type:complete